MPKLRQCVWLYERELTSVAEEFLGLICLKASDDTKERDEFGSAATVKSRSSNVPNGNIYVIASHQNLPPVAGTR